MNVLIIGGTGWVGHHMAQKVAARGHDVTILTRGSSGRFSPPPAAEMVQGDKNDAASFGELLKKLNPDVVMDSVPSESCIRTVMDILGDRIKRYAHCSSTGVYAPLQYVPANEGHPWRKPTGINFMHKVALDALVLDAHTASGFPATVIRPTNILGPGLLPLDPLGGRDREFLPDVAAGREVFLPNDGRALLQPVFVENVAEPFALALERPESIGQAYNVSGPHSVTLRDYVRLIANLLDTKPTLTCLPPDEILSRFGGTPKVNERGLQFVCEHMCFDLSKACSELGYSPSESLEATMKATIEWWRNQ